MGKACPTLSLILYYLSSPVTFSNLYSTNASPMKLSEKERVLQHANQISHNVANVVEVVVINHKGKQTAEYAWSACAGSSFVVKGQQTSV